jgi:putative ABC transport system permease protein
MALYSAPMNSLLLDVSTAVRFFARRRAAFAVIVLTTALALGANTAVFSVLKAFLFSQLGVPDAGRVGLVWTTKELPGRGRVDFSDAMPNYRLLRETTHSFESIGTSLLADVNWEQTDDTRRLQGARTTASFFEVMRVQPAFGRFYRSDEEGPKSAPVALISHALWRSAFGESADVLGRTLGLNGAPHTIIGVLPAGFGQPLGTDVWLPFDLPDNMWNAISGGRQLNTYARLKAGVTATAADLELRGFTVRAIEMDPANKDWSWRFQPLREVLLSGAGNAILFVEAGAVVLLILAICNLSSLLMAWAADRHRETAVRLALGASGWRLIRQFLVQSVLLVSIGGALGVALAWLTLPALQQLNPNPALQSFLAHIQLDWSTLGFAALLVLGAGLIAGLLPALQSRAVSFAEALRSETRGSTLTPTTLQWQRAMVVLQAAVSVLILVGAVLAGLGLYRLSRVQLGFATDRRVVMHLQFPEPAYATHEQRAKFAREVERNLAAEPALLRHAVVSSLPVGDIQWGGGFHLQLPSGELTKDPIVFHLRRASPGYLPLMQVPLISGRMLNENDRVDSPPVAVISQAAAEKYWPGESPIGRKMRRVSPPNVLVEIVGIVGNVRDAGAGLPAGETVYVPYDQLSLRRSWIVLQGRGSIEDTLAAGRRALRATDPGVAAFDVNTLDQLAVQATALPRLQVTLLSVFALIAIGITALGSYGVMSQLVANRQKEMAIRSALGATQAGVLRLVLLENARLAAAGTVVGLVAAWLAARGLQAKLTGFDASPLWPYVAVAAAILGLTQIASLIPARRAAKLDVHTVLSNA